jgi:hypothetical protein
MLYKIVRADDYSNQNQFEDILEGFLSSGWKLYGDPFAVGNAHYYVAQAITKEKT